MDTNEPRSIWLKLDGDTPVCFVWAMTKEEACSAGYLTEDAGAIPTQWRRVPRELRGAAVRGATVEGRYVVLGEQRWDLDASGRELGAGQNNAAPEAEAV